MIENKAKIKIESLHIIADICLIVCSLIVAHCARCESLLILTKFLRVQAMNTKQCYHVFVSVPYRIVSGMWLFSVLLHCISM